MIQTRAAVTLPKIFLLEALVQKQSGYVESLIADAVGILYSYWFRDFQRISFDIRKFTPTALSAK
jgi:hypothetical protein